jgi:hypothetical protein
VSVRSRIGNLEKAARRHTSPTCDWAEYEAAWKRSNARRRLHALTEAVEMRAG